MFDFHLDYQHATQLQGVKADYVSLARQALLKGDVSLPLLIPGLLGSVLT